MIAHLLKIYLFEERMLFNLLSSSFVPKSLQRISLK